jgi:hypothetical protein
MLWSTCTLGVSAAGASATGAADLRKVSLGAPGLRLAIADFDGDVRPDVATLQSDNTFSGTSNYAISLQLSAAGHKLIRLVGPAGGLLIEARDVNGDHVADLVIATRWQRTPIAIYLNDGHGDFSRAATNAFPSTFSESRTKWDSSDRAPNDSVGAPPRVGTSIGVFSRVKGWDPVAEGFRWLSLSRPLSESLLQSQSGRAPPQASTNL